MKSKFKAMVLSCIDPRFQVPVFKFMKKKNLIGKYSSFTIAGSAVGVTHSKFKKWHQAFLDNLGTSIKLHKIKKLIVVNHEDCGAVKLAENKKNYIEEDVHNNSFRKLERIINKKFPKLKLEFYIIKLNQKILRVRSLR
jgi:carbonic anhydrase